MGLINVWSGDGKGKCLRANTLIHSSLGLREIKTLGKGEVGEFSDDIENFSSRDLFGNIVMPNKFYNNGFDECYRTLTQSGYYIDTTSEHKLLSLNSVSGEFIWKKVCELNTGDFVALSRGDGLFGQGNLDSITAKYLGVLVADGSRNLISDKTYLQLQTKDEELVKFLSSNSEMVTGNSCISRKYGEKFSLNWSGDIHNRLLNDYGLDIFKTADNKTIPESILSANKETVVAFLMGLFTDFTINGSDRNMTIGYLCTNETLSYQVKTLLLKLGIFTSSRVLVVKTKKHPNGKDYYLLLMRGEEVINFNNIFNLSKVSKHIANFKNRGKSNTNMDIVPIKDYLVNKIKTTDHKSDAYKLLRNCRGIKNGIGYEKLKTYYELTGDIKVASILETNHLWQRVKSVEYIGKHETYDLNVPLTHSYTANNFISHNSTSAFGLIMRAHGNGLKPLVMQFLKGAEACEYGEVKTCKQLGIYVIQSGSNKVVLAKNKTSQDIEEAEFGWQELNKELKLNHYDLVVIDELLPVLQLELLDFNMVYSWLKEQRKNGNFELVLTGRMYEKTKVRKMKDIADLFSKVVCINHPFNTKCKECNLEFSFRYHYCPECGSELVVGKKARIGIEY